MKGKWVLPWCVFAALVLLVLAGLAQAAYPRLGARALALASPGVTAATPLGTAFTYQGRLEDDGQPVNATCTLSFALHNQATGGSQVGPPLSMPVAIADGLFTVGLDFGSSAFNGEARWLGIRVLCLGDSDYTDLGRQALTAAPYALYARAAPWSGLSGVPEGLADGKDGVDYANVVVVAKSGGDFESIQAALDSIVDAEAGNPYLLWVAPGVYSETVWMKPYVDIQGAGEGLTIIHSEECGNAALNGADNAELRTLTVEHIVASACDEAVAIRNSGVSPWIRQVIAVASGGWGTNIGVLNDEASTRMEDLTAVGVGPGFNNSGIQNGGGWPSMTNVTASASGGGANYGLVNRWTEVRMSNVTASASSFADSVESAAVYNDGSTVLMTGGSAGAVGAANAYGILNKYSTVTLAGVSIHASGAGNASWGVATWESTLTTRDSVIEAIGEGSCGMYHYAPSGSYTSTIDHSRITSGFVTVKYDGAYTVLVGATQLIGSHLGGDGTIQCAGVYDEDYVFYPGPDCPQ